MKQIITYRFDSEREMIYFSNNTQSLVTSSGEFLWNKKLYHEDMVNLSKDTGFVFIL